MIWNYQQGICFYSSVGKTSSHVLDFWKRLKLFHKLFQFSVFIWPDIYDLWMQNIEMNQNLFSGVHGNLSTTPSCLTCLD